MASGRSGGGRAAGSSAEEQREEVVAPTRSQPWDGAPAGSFQRGGAAGVPASASANRGAPPPPPPPPPLPPPPSDGTSQLGGQSPSRGHNRSGESPSAASGRSPGGRGQLQLPDGATSRPSSTASPSRQISGASGLATAQSSDLRDLIVELELEDRQDKVVDWCESQGLKFGEELVDHIDELVDHLKLDKTEALRVTLAAKQALQSAHASGPSPVRRPQNASLGGLPTQSLRTLSQILPPALDKTSTLSASERLVKTFSFAANITKARDRFRSLSGKLRSTQEEDEDEEGEAEESKSKSKKKSFAPPSRVSGAADGGEEEEEEEQKRKQEQKKQEQSKQDKQEDKEDAAEAPSAAAVESAASGLGLPRTATVSIFGPMSGVFTSMQVGDGEFSVQETSNKQAFEGRDQGSVEPETPELKLARAESTQRSNRPALRRRDTVGLETPSGVSERVALRNSVCQDGTQPKPLTDGQTGQVYYLEVGGEKIAVFKPAEGEKFNRQGVEQGQGCIREEAAYLVDRLSGGHAGVPVTSRANIEVDGRIQEGSVQRYFRDIVGCMEDFGMPRDIERAREFVPQEWAEALALLDMRILNSDRHEANLLLLKREKPHGLGPIDHGCCLPPWWLLGEARFDAWHGWAQLKEPPTQATRMLAHSAHENMPTVEHELRRVGLLDDAILTLKLCTLLMKVAVADLGVPLNRVADLVLRDPENYPPELSWLERQVLSASQAAGSNCRVGKEEKYGDDILEVSIPDSNFDRAVFLSTLEASFRSKVPAATKWFEKVDPLPVAQTRTVNQVTAPVSEAPPKTSSRRW